VSGSARVAPLAVGERLLPETLNLVQPFQTLFALGQAIQDSLLDIAAARSIAALAQKVFTRSSS
jgi:hypothetical protein